MCGILGFIHKDNINFPINEFSDALRSLDLRGRDNLGISEQVLGNKVLKLGHTRLSILDLESTGNQPMTSNSGNLQIVFKVPPRSTPNSITLVFLFLKISLCNFII